MNFSSEGQKTYCIYQCVSKDFRWDWAQTKKNMGRLNVANFTIDQWTHNCSIMKEMFSTHKKENLMLLKGLLEPLRTKFTDIWYEYKKRSGMIS